MCPKKEIGCCCRYDVDDEDTTTSINDNFNKRYNNILIGIPVLVGTVVMRYSCCCCCHHQKQQQRTTGSRSSCKFIRHGQLLVPKILLLLLLCTLLLAAEGTKIATTLESASIHRDWVGDNDDDDDIDSTTYLLHPPPNYLHIPIQTHYTMNNNNKNNNHSTVDHLQQQEQLLFLFPLVGIGVGNLQHERIQPLLLQYAQQLRNPRRQQQQQQKLEEEEHHDGTANGRTTIKTRTYETIPLLIDTAHASQNEHLIRNAIEDITLHTVTNIILLEQEQEQQQMILLKIHLPVHVVTKVWYTHLGYHRTILSVQESIQELTISPQSILQKLLVQLEEQQFQQNLSRIVVGIHLHLDVRVHMLLHWPRCREDIEWMDCDGEEKNVPQYVKQVDPYYQPNNDTSFLSSWSALEDMYISTGKEQNNNNNNLPKSYLKKKSSHNDPNNLRTNHIQNPYHLEQIAYGTTTTTKTTGVVDTKRLLSPNSRTYNGKEGDGEINVQITSRIRLRSIGISNFDVKDIQLLLQHANIVPHIIQGNVWSYLLDSELMNQITNKEIHFQAYNIMNGLIQPLVTNTNKKFPRTYHTLQQMKEELFPTSSSSSNNSTVSITQMILAWFVHHNVSIIPRTSGSNTEHLNDMNHDTIQPIVQKWNDIFNTIITNDHDKNNEATTKKNGFYNRWDTLMLLTLQATIQGMDVPLIPITFYYDQLLHSEVDDSVVLWNVYWYNPTSLEEILLCEEQPLEGTKTKDKNIVFTTNSHPGHIFVVKCNNHHYHNNTNDLSLCQQQFTVTMEYGENQSFQIMQPVTKNTNNSHDNKIRMQIPNNNGMEEVLTTTNNNDDDEEL